MAHAYEVKYEGTPEPNSWWRNSSYIIVCVSVPFWFNWLQWLGFVGKWTLFTWELGPFFPFPLSGVLWCSYELVYASSIWQSLQVRRHERTGRWGFGGCSCFSTFLPHMIADLNYSEMLYHHLEHWYVSPAVAILQESTHLMEAGRDVLTCSISKNSCSSVYILSLLSIPLRISSEYIVGMHFLHNCSHTWFCYSVWNRFCKTARHWQ